jgi:transposase
MTKKNLKTSSKASRRVYPSELKDEALLMFQDGHSASSIASRLGLPNPGLIHAWRKQRAKSLPQSPAADERVRQLLAEVARLQRERDILKKALAIFSQKE